jgi:hypothetical protein
LFNEIDVKCSAKTFVHLFRRVRHPKRAECYSLFHVYRYYKCQAERIKLRHAPKDVNREAELRRSTRVVWSA